jgi:hypothetical protein
MTYNEAKSSQRNRLGDRSEVYGWIGEEKLPVLKYLGYLGTIGYKEGPAHTREAFHDAEIYMGACTNYGCLFWHT